MGFAFDKTFPGSLFWDGSLLDLMQAQNAGLIATVGSCEKKVLLGGNLDELAKSLCEQYALQPVILHRDRVQIIEYGQTTIDHGNRTCLVFYDPQFSENSAATFYTFAAPFEGDGRLFARRPSEFETELPWGQVVGNELQVLCKTTSRDRDAIRSRVEDNFNRIERWLRRVNSEVEPFNSGLCRVALERLQARKAKLCRDDDLVQSLGFPLRPRAGGAATYTAPLTRRKLPIGTSIVASTAFKPEPVLNTEHYQHILGVISNMVLVMERSPASFAGLDEEGLRTHILVQLNGHYEGQATGETFNAEGKTDILIRVEARNIFIAECKFWKGAEVFKKTIDQLLGYAAWRDTKTAIIVFSRNRDTSAVVKQIPDLVKAHATFRREIAGYESETGFQFILCHRDDKDRELMLTVLVFDVPA